MPQINRLPKAKRKTENSDRRKIRKQFYNLKKWKDLRIAKLNDNPLCEMCLENDIITPAIDVHHIISFTKGKDKSEMMMYFLDYSNLKSLCKVCHSYIHSFQKNNDIPNE